MTKWKSVRQIFLAIREFEYEAAWQSSMASNFIGGTFYFSAFKSVSSKSFRRGELRYRRFGMKRTVAF